ncbi:MAG: hypothetical protein P0Y56_09530 [Candidatus Andeanibacterium colombiense]|uniref:Lipoprotein n=1 Tax=Candidatus Andeanibacterium colombiense TaxID=3121345 RepID=A0AAJ5X663_9SPHN|nr:MAG: hypothetical protein P0Y56_09530 [Sphingomonadaceae bacterium]
MIDRYPGMTRYPALLACALLAACSSGKKDEAPPTPSPSASPAPAPSPSRIFTYTSLENCPVLESNPDEAGYYLSECKGEGGYRLQVAESDLRQTVTVIAPGGAKTALDLSAVTGGGFSTLGKKVEWRGALKDGVFAPDALILRHAVVTDPEGERTVSYLVAITLVPAPCPVARIDPGPQQNEQARVAADAAGACLKGSA